MSCQEKGLILYKNYSSKFDSVDWLSIAFDSVISLDGFTMKFKLGNAVRDFNDLSQPSIINLTKQETNAFDLGLNNASIIVTDTEGNAKPFTTAIPVLVKNWVEGDQKLDTFNMNVNVTLDNMKQFTIKIETAKVSQELVEGLIEEHNQDETAHPFIQQNITIEATARANADTELQNNINEKQDILTSENAGDNISITNVGGVVKINSQGGGVTVHNQLTGRDASNAHPMSAINGLVSALAGKQPVGEYATAEQGEKADTAIQPNDNISELTNDSNFQTYTQVISDIVSLIVNNTTSTDVDKVLSAAAGKSLQDQINNLSARGKYLSIWDCTTGLAMDDPPVNPYTIETGSFFIVGKVASAGGTNYRPNGGIYDKDVPSRVVETTDVTVNATYYWDSTQWRLLEAPIIDVAFSTLAGSPYDNDNLAAALNGKQALIDAQHKLNSDLISDTDQTNKFVTAQEKTTWNSKQEALVSGSNIKTINNTAILGSGNIAVATSAQGAKADTAVQPNDNVSALTNDAGYITSSYHDDTKQDKITSTNKLSYSLLSGTPTKVSDFTNDVGYITAGDVEANIKDITPANRIINIDLSDTTQFSKDSQTYGWTYNSTYGLCPENSKTIHGSGVANSFAYCKWDFAYTVPIKITIDFTQDSQSTYDYLALGCYDYYVSKSYSVGTYHYRTYNKSGNFSVEIYVPAGEHFLTWKYIKNSSTDTGLDMCYIRSIKVEKLEPIKLKNVETNEERIIDLSKQPVFAKYNETPYITLKTALMCSMPVFCSYNGYLYVNSYTSTSPSATTSVSLSCAYTTSTTSATIYYMNISNTNNYSANSFAVMPTSRIANDMNASTTIAPSKTAVINYVAEKIDTAINQAMEDSY